MLSSNNRKRRHEEFDEDSTDESNQSTSNSRYGTNQTIPQNTSEWEPYIVDKLHVRWDDASRSPDDLLNMCNAIPSLNKELIEIADYITEKINIDFPFSRLKSMSITDLRAVGQQLSDIKSELQNLASAGSDSEFKLNVHTHGQVFVEAVKKLIYFLCVEETSYEPVFVPVLREFCKTCSFLGCDGVVKRELIIEGCAVTALPDLQFMDVQLPVGSHGYFTVSIAEIKTLDEEDNGNSGSRLASDLREPTTSKFLLRELEGTSQHAGQLLLEAKRSAFKPFSYGSLIIGSKIIMTCLKVSPYYFNHVGEGLREEDEGQLFYSNMYDMFKAEDRRILVMAFLRLAQAQCIKQNLL